MSPKLFSPWAQRIFNWGRICPNLWWEAINIASVESLGHGPLFQQERSIMGGKRRWRRGECCPAFCLPIKLYLFAKHELRKLCSPRNPKYLPQFLGDTFGSWHLGFVSLPDWMNRLWLHSGSKSKSWVHGPILSVIQWGRVGACLIYVQISPPLLPHGASKSEILVA